MKIEAKARLIADTTRTQPNHTALYAALVQAGIIEKIKSLPNIGNKAKTALIHEVKEQVHHVAQNLGTTKDAVVTAFKEPKMSNLLEAAGYSFATLWGAMHLGHKVAQQGALHVIAHFAEHTALHKIAHKGAHRAKVVDEFMKKYPVLKKVSGPALAGLMLYGYTLTEPHKLADWDMANIKKAFSGEFGVSDFLQTPEALYLGTHVATGKVISLSALAESTTTLALGLTCTAIMQSKNPKLQAIAGKIQGVAAKFKPKKSVLNDLESSKGFTGNDVLKQISNDSSGKSGSSGSQTPRPQSEDKTNPKNLSKEELLKDDKRDAKKSAPDWWRAMSKEAQENYLELHPNSIYQPS